MELPWKGKWIFVVIIQQQILLFHTIMNESNYFNKHVNHTLMRPKKIVNRRCIKGLNERTKDKNSLFTHTTLSLVFFFLKCKEKASSLIFKGILWTNNYKQLVSAGVLLKMNQRPHCFASLLTPTFPPTTDLLFFLMKMKPEANSEIH